MYEVVIDDDDDSDAWARARNKLTITDSNGTREYCDYGEPEDNSFLRDYSWVKQELKKAHNQGYKDATFDHFPDSIAKEIIRIYNERQEELTRATDEKREENKTLHA
jgi:hypothetical protein